MSHDLLQIRWETCKERPDDIEARARGYLSRLEEAAKKKRDPITSSKVAAVETGVEFRWRGSVKGVGRAFYEPESRRVFIVERSGKRNDSLTGETTRLLDTFRPSPSWCVLGFEVRPPADADLERFKFLTGRITFHFKAKGLELTAERWGLADSILKKHSLVDWAKAVCDADSAEGDGPGLRLKGSPSLPKRALGYVAESLVRHDAPLNRLLLLRAIHKSREPEWSWLP